LPLCSSALQLVLRRAFYLQHGQLIEMNWQLVTMKLFIHLPLCPSLLIWLSLGIFFRDFVNFLSRKVWGTRQAYTPSSAFRAPLRTTTGPGPAYGSTTGLRVYGPGLRARALGLRYGLYGPTGLRALWAHGPGLRAYGPGPGASQGSMAVYIYISYHDIIGGGIWILWNFTNNVLIGMMPQYGHDLTSDRGLM
jgi:hypothetical protein